MRRDWLGFLVVLAASGCGDPPPNAPRRCNGSEVLCARAWDQVTLAGAHNAFATSPEFGAANQRLTIPEQLELGVRAFMLDTYGSNDSGGVVLCHGPCALGQTPLSDVLASFAVFIDEHPDDFIELLVQDDASGEDFAAVVDAAGLTDDVLAHEPGEPWPTLGELLDTGANIFVTSENAGPPPDWYQPMFEHYAETPFSFESLDAMTCAPNRGDEDNALFLVNHFISNPLPDESAAAEVNSAAVLRERVTRCESERGKRAHVLALDFVETGDLIAVVNELNAATGE